MAAAAAEAPRSSSSGSADSYIGSLISLTSKSEIRYEGVLFNINTEESSIGLRNVRSFGTEGRRKEGLQVPPSDKIYEYILFRGSDIKDLQVKSSPPVQPTTSIHNDPAIIQSHYSQAASTSLPSGTGSLPDPTSQTAQLGLSTPNFHGNPSLYQPGRSLGPWGSSPVPTTNGVGLPMPLYWQGFYGSSNGLQGQQQALLQPAHGLPMLPSLQQPMQYPAMNASLSTGSSNLAASHLSEHRPPLMPPISTGTFNFLSPTPPATISDTSTNLIPDKASAQTLPTAASKTSLPLVPALNTGVDDTAAAAVSEPKPIPGSLMPFQSLSESTSAIGMSSSILNDGKMPSLVTPDQLLHPGLPTVSSLQSPQTAQKDVEVVQLSSSESPPPPQASSIDVQEPLLPLPSTTERKPYGRATTYTQYGYRGGRGRGRGRGNEISRSATKFTEDFDFSAMNEKFNKDEVWGHLGKSNKAQEDGDNYEDEEDVGSSKHETKPVYVKDDFFDSLSCDALGGGSRNGRPRFSEQVRRDTETFGDFPRYSGGRGGRGPYRGGRARGSYHGRGYGYAPRGRGYGMSGAS